MYCFNCGNEIVDHSKFCSYCGVKIESNNLHERVVKDVSMDIRKYEQNVRKGTLVYLQDILSLEFSINKLQNELNSIKNTMTIYNYWFYWECYELRNPIKEYHVGDYTKLYLSYSHRLDRYYWEIVRPGDYLYFVDYNGNSVNHKYGLVCNSKVMDKETRNKLCTVPIFETRGGLFSKKLVLVNRDSTYWATFAYENENNLSCFAEIKGYIELFEDKVKKRDEYYNKQMPIYDKQLIEIEKELVDAKKILNDLYNLNIIPNKYRNIGCIYFIYDFFSTAKIPLSNVFFHLDFDKIQSQLDKVINNQQESIIQTSKMLAQNEKIISQNRMMFDELVNMSRNVDSTLNSIQEASIETTKWAEIAALNTETCAWLGLSNYLK